MSERSFREPRRRGFDNGFVPTRPRGQRAAAIPTAPRRQPTSGPPIRATVKWFSPDKGFGFVVPDDGSGDAFLHASVAEQSGRNGAEMQPGMVLQVRVGQGQRGTQVTEILAVEEGATAGSQAPARATRPAFAQTTPGRSSRMTGTVKWYDPGRRFGFVAIDGGQKEVFVHATALRHSCLASLTQGQRVTMEVGEGRKGPEAVTVSVAG